MNESESKNWKMFLRRIRPYAIVALVSAALAVGITLLVVFCNRSKLTRLEEIIDKYYIGDADKAAIEDAAAYAMVDALGNRWSYYIPASEYQAYLDRQTNTYVGIGITIERAEDGEGFRITKVEPGSGAEAAGIKAGDLLIAVEGKKVKELGFDAAAEMIRGDEGTKVNVTVLRDGKELTLSPERMTIKTVVATGKMLEDNIGLVTINNFNQRCAKETIAIIEDLQSKGATAFIFDVRFNPGGYKDELVKVLDYLLPEGELFRSEDYSGKTEVDTSDSRCLKLPMAVLLNGDSYSAAEFFAAALREYEWATLVGQSSTGKSHFQITIPLGDGSAVNLSVGKYYTPKGVSLADVGGLKPDVEIPVDETTYMAIYSETIDPESDPQIQAAVEVLKSGK